MLEVTIVMEDGHIFTLNIRSFIEAPVKGALMKCKVCGENKKIQSVGIPHRLPENGDRRVDDNQSSILKE